MPKLLTWCIAVLLACLSFAAPAAAQPQVVEVSAKPSKAAVTPGEQFAIAVLLEHEEGWHVHTNEPEVPRGADFVAVPTEIVVLDLPKGAQQWAIQWPRPHEITIPAKGGRAPYKVFDGRAIAYLPVSVPENIAVGSTATFEIGVKFQACDDTSCMPVEEIKLSIPVSVVSLEQQAAMQAPPKDADFDAFDPLVFGAKPLSGAAAKRLKIDVFGWKFSINTAGVGLVLLLLIAALGGFLLNLTPCVLPVLPLKIMGISAAAGNPARCLYLGTVMSSGVVAFWIAIGGAIAFVAGFTAISSLFQTPWFSIGVGLFILLMAIGMLGAYAVQLPKAVYMVNPNHETAPGSFLFGIMTAVLSTPCTAPFMGSAAAWAATQNPAITMATFGAIGVGMALPYLLLSAFPGLVRKVPRTGPASELIKQIMGLLLVAVAIFFLGTGTDPLLRLPVDPPVRFFWWIIGGVAIGAMLWLVYRTFKITRRPVLRGVWTGFAAVFAALSLTVTLHFTAREPIPWVGYTPDRLAESLSNNQVVVMDFTAEWCLNCKAQKVAALHRPEIVALLKHPSVVPMKVDLTGNNREGAKKLKELDWVGIPLLAIYGPNLREPIKYDAYTADMVRQAVQDAGGPSGPVAAAGARQAPAR